MAAEVAFCPTHGKKAQKDSTALSSQRAAETEALVKRRAEKSKRQEAPREIILHLLTMEAEESISSIWGDSSSSHPSLLPKSLRLPYGVGEAT
ncbi:hypothetical protein PoB_002720700 [Plakobranchus ocellatus]|uniref:Uncharacterized protein n=1 Tax=Plakobranchus ocellatus TaxID=259542 RepID=A0AAV4A1E9_9GAST|nr:hypothetical protein PoB_002720700 [Plakobranchus ocellatus]